MATRLDGLINVATSMANDLVFSLMEQILTPKSAPLHLRNETIGIWAYYIFLFSPISLYLSSFFAESAHPHCPSSASLPPHRTLLPPYPHRCRLPPSMRRHHLPTFLCGPTLPPPSKSKAHWGQGGELVAGGMWPCLHGLVRFGPE